MITCPRFKGGDSEGTRILSTTAAPESVGQVNSHLGAAVNLSTDPTAVYKMKIGCWTVNRYLGISWPLLLTAMWCGQESGTTINRGNENSRNLWLSFQRLLPHGSYFLSYSCLVSCRVKGFSFKRPRNGKEKENYSWPSNRYISSISFETTNLSFPWLSRDEDSRPSHEIFSSKRKMSTASQEKIS